MDIAELERLLELVESANIHEITLRQGEARVTIRKSRCFADNAAPEVAPVAEPDAHTALVSSAVTIGEPAPTAAGPPVKGVGLAIDAPLVGIFHHVKPIVSLGARVEEGQVIGVIESMKLLNDVTAPVTGSVSDVLVEDGHPVEYGEALFVIEPASTRPGRRSRN